MLQRHHHQDHAARLVRIWEGLPNCSIVIFRHIQKTAGTSVRSLFENLQRDWQWSVHAYWNPCWKGQAPGVAIERMRLVRSMRERLAAGEKSLAPPMAPVASGPPHLRQLHLLHHPDSTFCGGMRGLERELHAARPSLLSRGCRTTVAMMVREPWSFHRSWYVYIGARRCDRCLFPAYVELNPNAQSHLVLGYRPRVYDAELRRRHVQRDPALARELDEQLRAVDLVAPMERIGEFLLLLCDLAGLRECPHVGRHNHATSFSDRNEFKLIARKHNVTIAEVAPSPSHPAHAAAVANYSWLDDVLYARAIAAFEISVADAQRRWPGGADGWREAVARRAGAPEDDASTCFEFDDFGEQAKGGGGAPTLTPPDARALGATTRIGLRWARGATSERCRATRTAAAGRAALAGAPIRERKLTAATAAAEGRPPPPVLRMCRTKEWNPRPGRRRPLDGAPKPAERMDCKDFREAWNLTRGGGMNLW